MLKQRLDQFIKRLKEPARVDKASQILLALRYRELAQTKSFLPGFRDVGFRAYSQNDEDGVLLYIFSVIGAESRYSVEICAGTGMECNSANLILNHGWHSLLVDGNPDNIDIARQFYAGHPDTLVVSPAIAHVWVDRDNVNSVIASNGFTGQIDLLSIDLDGNDYWIWEAITVARPRVVVVECQPMWGAERAVTIPYDSRFVLQQDRSSYHGASLPAFVSLGRRLGYRLVGANRFGFNAFFVRDDIGRDVLPEVGAAECVVQPHLAAARKARLEKVAHLKWIDVE